jgi:tRNA (guanine37-N1)-methyltransferase
MTLRLDVVTLFPELYPGPLGLSISGRALERGLASLQAHDLRRWGLGRHRSVDDYPYGGGAGMVLRPEPIAAALDALRTPRALAVLLDPAGEPFRQARAAELATRSHLIFVCPRYEGVDERVRGLVELELSVGDVVVSGGDLPAMLVMDALLRLLPGAIDAASPVEESFTAGLLEYPHYTRPPEFRGQRVPEVLVSGDHGAVERWRRDEARARTRQRRPDLLAPPERPGAAGVAAPPEEVSGS